MKKRFIILSLLFIINLVMLGITSAQTTPDAVPTPVIPTIEVDSIVFNDTLEIFEVNLRFTNQGQIGGLEVKVENTRNNNLVRQDRYPTVANFNLDATELTRGEEYILTVTGLDATGSFLQLLVPQSFGEAVLTTIQTTREFEYDESAPIDIGFARIELDEVNEIYNITLDLINTDDVEQYTFWLQSEAGLVVSEEFVFLAPLPSPIPLSLVGIEQGDYIINVEGTDVQDILLVRSQSEKISYVPTGCDIVCAISNNPALIVIVTIIVVLSLMLLSYSFFKPKPKSYVIERSNQPQQNLLDDTDMSLFMRNDHHNKGRAPKLQLILEGGIPMTDKNRQIAVRSSTFHIGRTPQKNHLTLNSEKISGEHARIYVQNGVYYIEDLQSRNGTSLNGIYLTANMPQQVKDNDRISFHNISYLVKIQ